MLWNVVSTNVLSGLSKRNIIKIHSFNNLRSCMPLLIYTNTKKEDMNTASTIQAGILIRRQKLCFCSMRHQGRYLDCDERQMYLMSRRNNHTVTPVTLRRSKDIGKEDPNPVCTTITTVFILCPADTISSEGRIPFCSLMFGNAEFFLWKKLHNLRLACY